MWVIKINIVNPCFAMIVSLRKTITNYITDFRKKFLLVFKRPGNIVIS